MKIKKTIVVGLSGGVDSAVAALILKKEGYKVIGAFMKNFSDTKNKITGECLWAAEKREAQKVAAKLQIPFVTFDFEKQYKKQVIAPMFKAYESGLTPNPDVLCNQKIKFPLFWKEAKKLGAGYIAMGHYITKKENKKTNTFNLLRGKDETKDQSYFLYELTQKDLQHTLFPIGNYTKKQVREIAKAHKLPNYNKKSTRGICFVGKINLKSYLKTKIKEKPGIILTPEGKEVGKHKGVMFHTIGERLGPRLGFDIDKKFRNQSGKKWYIIDKNKRKNILIAAPENHPSSLRKRFIITKINVINPKEKIPKTVKVRIRHLGKLMSSTLSKSKNNYICTLKKPISGLAEGQNAIIYQRRKMLAGGEIRFR